MPNIKLTNNQKLEQKFMDHMRSDNAQNEIESKMKLWMSHDEQLAQAETLWDFKQIMAHYDEFGQQETQMVDAAYTQYLETLLAENCLAESDK